MVSYLVVHRQVVWQVLVGYMQVVYKLEGLEEYKMEVCRVVELLEELVVYMVGMLVVCMVGMSVVCMVEKLVVCMVEKLVVCMGVKLEVVHKLVEEVCKVVRQEEVHMVVVCMVVQQALRVGTQVVQLLLVVQEEGNQVQEKIWVVLDSCILSLVEGTDSHPAQQRRQWML